MIEPSSSQSPGPRRPPRAYVRLIADVRARQRRQLWLQGGLHGATAAVLLVALAGFAGRLSPALGGVLLALAPVAAAGALVLFGVVRAKRVVGDELRTARLIGQRVPGMSLELLAAVELERALARAPDFSVQLARAHIDETSHYAAVLDPSAVVDRRPIRLAARGLAGAFLVLLVLLGAWPRAWMAGVRATLARRAGAVPETRREPITGDIELTYRYPPYTGLAPRTVTGTNGEIAAPAGTEVLLKTRADREVERAEVLVNGRRLPLEVSGQRELKGSLVLDQSGAYAFVFLSGRGRELARGPDTPIRVEADGPPRVVLLTPGEELEVDPGEEVVLKYEATDDYGITSLELIFRPPGKAQEVRVPLRHDEGRRSRGQHTWKLSGFDAPPGSRISYRLEARDNDEPAGKKKGASRTHLLKVYSAAEHRRAAVRKVEELWERLIGHLADRLEGPDRTPEKGPDRVAEEQSRDRAGLMLVGDLRAAAEEIASERDAPEELWAALRHIAAGLSPKVRLTAEARRLYVRQRQAKAADQAFGRRLVQAVTTEITELEKDVLYLESLIDQRKLQDLQELARELARERRELASLIEQYKESQDPNLREDILRQINELKARMSELLQKMGELARGIRDEHVNAEALQKLMEERDMGASLEEVEKLMREGKADEALRKLQELASQFEEMLQGLDKAGDDMGEEQFPGLTEKFEELSRELKRTTNDQKRVAEETKEVKDRYRAQIKERLQQRGRALKEQLLQEVAELQRSYKEVDSGALSPSAERPLEDVEGELRNLESALQVEDFDLATEAAGRAEQAAGDLRGHGEQVRQMDEYLNRPQEMRARSRELAERLGRDAERVGDINRRLQQLFPPPGTMLSEQDRSKLKDLAGEQRQLERRAEELRQRMQEIEQMAPLFGEEGMEQMGQVGERMGRAADWMGGREPGRAQSEQQAALDGLSQLQQKMQQQQQGREKGGGLPLPMLAGRRGSWGRGPSAEKVELPDEDQFQAPKEFRKDLLDAMKQGAPDRYKEQVKRYYEELVK